jgi:hypothetical protein
MKKPGGDEPPGRICRDGVRSAEDAKHDGADEGKRDIRGHDTQPADGHGKLPSFTSLPASNGQFTKPFRGKKVRLAVRAPRKAAPGGPIPTFALHRSKRFANVGIKGPPENMDSRGA